MAEGAPPDPLADDARLSPIESVAVALLYAPVFQSALLTYWLQFFFRLYFSRNKFLKVVLIHRATDDIFAETIALNRGKKK